MASKRGPLAEGTRVRLHSSVGRDRGRLEAGQEARVAIPFIAAGTPGGSATEDVLVIEFDGADLHGVEQRRWSLATDRWRDYLEVIE